MSLGNKILDLRKKKGLSQEQLGEQVNVTRQTILNWELGERVSNTEKLAGIVIKILKILGIAFAALFTIDLIALILFYVFRFVG